MSQYNWSKRYQIPDICFKTEKNSYQPKGFDHKLRETIDVGSVRNNDLNPKTDRTMSSFTQSLRHTTDQRTTLNDLLGKSYKYFEPRPCRLKHDFAHNATFDNFHYDTSKKYSNYEPSTNTSSRDMRIRSLKEINQNSREQNSVLYKNDKLWNSSKLIHLSTNIEDLKTPEKNKQSEEAESPYTFVKKNKLLYTTPQSHKLQKSDETSTKYGSPTGSIQSSMRFLTLRQIKKESIRPPTLDDFAIIKNLGEGRFGAVSMAIHKNTGLLVAIKKVKKSVIKAHKLQNQFTMEMKMQLFLQHPNILKLYGYFDDCENVYLILQFMEEGTLFNKLKKEKQKHFDQKGASQRMDDVLHAIKYMHNREVAHRDIKPENIVMSNGVCKLCDFGWAAVCQNRRTTLCGTIDYAPPEVLEGKEYGLTMDLWCLGVLCYELLVGKAPFYHVSRKQTMQKIIKADTSELKLPEQLSMEAIDFISRLLIKDPQERMSAQDALEHDFIRRHVELDDQNLRGKYR